MDAHSPRVCVIRRRCAPQTFPCPTCGQRGRRKDAPTSRVRDLASGQNLVIDVTVGEYRAGCKCRTTFRDRAPACSQILLRIRRRPHGRAAVGNF